MRNVFAADVNNTVNVRNVYGAAAGPTVAQRGGAATPYVAGGTAASGAAPTGPGAGPIAGGGLMGQPFSWWVVLVGLLVGLMFVAQRFGGQADDFKTIRLSIYNIVIISIAAMIGTGFAKIVFTRYRVRGLSEYVMAL